MVLTDYSDRIILQVVDNFRNSQEWLLMANKYIYIPILLQYIQYASKHPQRTPLASPHDWIKGFVAI